MEIREVRREDTTAIAAIYNHYIANTTITFETKAVDGAEMARRIDDISSTYPYLVCEDGGRLAGYCYVHQWKGKAAYDATAEVTIYLDPECRGRRIGSALMDSLIGECRKRGFHALIACITVPNDPSVKFHERYGFKRVSYFPEVGRKFGKWLDIHDFQLILK